MVNKFLKDLRTGLLSKPGVRQAYEEQAPEYAIARAIIAARIHAGFTQTALAERMETSQSHVARLESGRALPSLRTLLKIAEATGTEAQFTLTPKHVGRARQQPATARAV